MSYRMKIVYITNLCAIGYVALAWIVGRLTWPLAGFVFVFWLLLPFVVQWSWPEGSEQPLWGRTIVGAIMISLASAGAFILIAG
jgi:hypothetical protein